MTANDKVLSEKDRSEIVKDILTRQLKMEDNVFSQSWIVSTENIEDMREPLLDKSKFHMIAPEEIEQQAQHYVVEFQVFKKFTVKDGQAEVTVLRVAEGDTCFGGYMKSQGAMTYVYRQEAGKWVYDRRRRVVLQRTEFKVKKKATL